MWKIRNDTLADMLDRHVTDAKLRSILSVYWGYFGLPPSKLSGFLYAIATADYVRHGAHYISRRSQDLSDALVASIEAAGGEVVLGSEATQIHVEDGAVTGVVIDADRNLKARAVISNANVPATMGMITQNFGSKKGNDTLQKYLTKLRQFRPSLSSFVVWLGLNQEIKDKIKEYEIFISRDYDPEKAYAASLACDPEKADLIVTIYDNALQGYSVPGTSSVTIMMLSGYEPWKRFETDYFAGRKTAYRKQKDRITQSLIQQIGAREIPGLDEMIEVVEAATPLTNLRYTANPEGAIYGYEQTLENAFISRLQQRTPLKGLYLASAWTSPGGGFNPCLRSGADAFKHMLNDLSNL
jgi:prolycopene isomerase